MLSSRTAILLGIFALVHRANSIIKGKPIPFAGQEHMASIWVEDEFVCGGALLAPKYVLTADQCVAGVSRSVVKVKVGSEDIRLGHIMPVERIIRYDENERSDLAILQLSQDVDQNWPVRFVKLNLDWHVPLPCEKCLITGWGDTRPTSSFMPKQLRGGYVQRTFEEKHSDVEPFLGANQITVGNPETYEAIGDKDTGGLLLCRGLATGILVKALRTNTYGIRTSLVHILHPHALWVDMVVKGQI